MATSGRWAGYHGEVFARRQAEAKELGLWTQPTTSDESERRRAELAGLGFADYDTDKWEQLVATLRAANSGRRASPSSAVPTDPDTDPGETPPKTV